MAVPRRRLTLAELSPDEILDICGPSWAEMTPLERELYGLRGSGWLRDALTRARLEREAA